jgi:hypothetical protein
METIYSKVDTNEEQSGTVSCKVSKEWKHKIINRLREQKISEI